MHHRTRTLLTVAAALLLPLSAAAKDGSKDGPFSVDFSAGAQYDSNVAVLELDASSGQGDMAALIDFGAGFEKPLGQRFKMKLGYDFSQTLHEEFDAFDIRIHRGSAALTHDFGRVDAGVSFVYADAALDDEGFLVLERTAPFVSRLFGKHLFLRLEFAHSDKTFESSPSRNATSEAWSTDAFFFLDGVKSYLVFSHQQETDDALDSEFDYDGSRNKFQVARKFNSGRRPITLKLEARHESRDYDLAQQSLGERRQDDRYGLDANLEVPVAKAVALVIRYRYNDNRSNLSSVNFTEHVASVKLGAKF